MLIIKKRLELIDIQLFVGDLFVKTAYGNTEPTISLEIKKHGIGNSIDLSIQEVQDLVENVSAKITEYQTRMAEAKNG